MLVRTPPTSSPLHNVEFFFILYTYLLSSGVVPYTVKLYSKVPRVNFDVGVPRSTDIPRGVTRGWFTEGELTDLVSLNVCRNPNIECTLRSRLP